MRRTRLYLAATATAALAAASGMALMPALASATPASAAVFCNSTSLVAGTSDNGAVELRVPSVGLDTGDDNCNLAENDEPDGSTTVMRLQIGLNSNCNFSAGLKVDGDFGPLTEAAVKRAQTGLGVPADGEYGPVTGAAMEWPVAGSNGTACGHILSISS
jgi:murein L,D-transpeptidase YcbB/YkuD